MAKVKDMLIEKYEPKVAELAQATGHDCDYLWDLWLDTLMDPTNIDAEERRWSDFCGVTLGSDWSYRKKVAELAYCTGYDFDFLWGIWMECLEERAEISEEANWSYFRGVTLEFDW